jgi:tetratricopeptide (TPR) repeat protein
MGNLELASVDADIALEIEPLLKEAHMVKGAVEMARYDARQWGGDGKVVQARSPSPFEWGLAPSPTVGILRARPAPRENDADAQAILTRAAGHYRRAADLDPGNALPRAFLAVIMYKQGKKGEALKMASAAVELPPESPFTYQCRAELYRMEGQYGQAIADLNKVLSQLEAQGAEAPAVRAEVLAARAECYLMEGQPAKGLADADRAIALSAGSLWFARLVRVRCLADLEREEEVVTEANALLEEVPACVDAYAERARALYRLLRWREALRDWNKVAVLASDAPDGYYGRARCYEALGDLQKAIAAVSTAIDHDPDAEFFCMRAQFYALSGKSAEARADLARVPDLGNRAIPLAVLGDFSLAAQGFYQDALLGDPYDRLLHFIYASRSRAGTVGMELLAEIPKTRDAPPWIRQVARLYLGQAKERDAYGAIPQSPDLARRMAQCEVFFYLGAHRHLRGDSKGAEDLYEKCVALGVWAYLEHTLALGELRRLGD